MRMDTVADMCVGWLSVAVTVAVYVLNPTPPDAAALAGAS